MPDVAAALPVQVIGELMGIPEAGRAQLRDWAEQVTGNQDPEVNPGGNDTTNLNAGEAEGCREAPSATPGAFSGCIRP